MFWAFFILAQSVTNGTTPGGDMSIQALASIVVNVGLAAGLVLFFVFKTDKREQKSEDRIKALEEFQKTTLMTLVKENASLYQKNIEVLERNVEVLEKCSRCLDKRGG